MTLPSSLVKSFLLITPHVFWAVLMVLNPALSLNFSMSICEMVSSRPTAGAQVEVGTTKAHLGYGLQALPGDLHGRFLLRREERLVLSLGLWLG